MKLSRYGLIESKSSRPHINLIGVPGDKEDLVVARFGPDTYAVNRAAMRQEYTHSSDVLSMPIITFKPKTTAESIAIVACKFRDLAKKDIFNPNWLQAGYVLRDSEGVWANPPVADNGEPIVDAKTLNALRDRATKLGVKNGDIYVGEDGFGFVDYGLFTRDVQDADTFVTEGLARVLENTTEPIARNLKTIADKANYPRGVNVWGFDPVKTPALKIVSLTSGRLLASYRLYVGGNSCNCENDGYAFGGLNSGEASAQKN